MLTVATNWRRAARRSYSLVAADMENLSNYRIHHSPRPESPSTTTAPPKWDPRAPMYASEDGRVASLSSQECIFFVKGSGAPHVMTLQVLQALDQCREFRTLYDHAVRIESTVPGLAGKGDDILRVLDSLVQRKLLVRDEDFIARFNSAAERVPPPLRAVFIRACDRPARLASLLASLVGYERHYRANRHYVLIDDSVNARHIDEQRDSLREFASETGCKVSYVGRSASAKLAEKLTKANPAARDAIRALLLRGSHPQAQRFGGGRSRNLALLLSAGARLILLDDDLRLPLLRPHFAQPGLEPNPGASAHARFFANMEQAFTSGSEIDEDPFELHLQVCGHSLGACVNGRYGLSRDALRGVNLGGLGLLKPDARVITSHHGSCGSSRSESALWLYHAIDRVGREEFWQDRESYDRNVHAHYVMYAADKARVLEVPGFTPFALDNSLLLPCTNPVGRAEDSLGSALTRYCQPDAVALELPVAIGHVQETLRKRFPITQGVSPPRVNDFLREFVRRQFGESKAEDPGQRLAFLAHVMRDLSHASIKERSSHLSEYRSFVHAEIIDRLQRQLETATDAPVYWQSDVRAIVQAHAKTLLASDAPPRLAEWPDDIDSTGCARALSGELDTMADACENWPAIWQYAAEQGETLLRALD
jgi:hypothetical protein